MPPPHPAVVALTADERADLAALLRRHTAGQQVVLRARIVLAAAAGLTDCQRAREVGVARATVRRWRRRWRGGAGGALADLSVRARLADAPRGGRPARITAEQFGRLIAVACAAPSASGRPISQWTGREIAAELIARGVVATISPRHAARLLQRGIAGPIASAPG